jgi:hypothetical protein
MNCVLFFTVFRTNCFSCAWILSASLVLAGEEYKGKVMWVLEQVDVFIKLGKGLSIGVVRHHYDINILTIHLIKENEYMGRWNVNASATFSVKISCVSHRDSLSWKGRKDLVYMTECRRWRLSYHHKEVYEGMQKEAEQSKSTCIFIKSSLWLSIRHCVSFGHSDSF